MVSKNKYFQKYLLDDAQTYLGKLKELGLDIEDVTDGYHSFKDLYYQRLILFVVLVKQNRFTSWKTYCHEDGTECFGGGWFLVTIDTPAGSYGYHFENEYWSLFDCKILPVAKHWDGYTDKDVDRLLSLVQ